MDKAEAHLRSQRLLNALRHLEDFADQAVIGKHLELLYEKFEMLNLIRAPDTGEWIGTVSADGVRRNAVRKDLLTCLQALIGTEKLKTCRDCHEVKPLSAFSFDKSRDDGHNRSCLVCERARVKAHAQKKKGQGS